MKRFLLVVLVLVLAVLAIMFLRASTLESRQPPVPEPLEVRVDAETVAAHLAAAITYPTISHDDRSNLDREAFLGLHSWAQQTYPALHGALERETVNELSLLYTWRGSDPALDPVLLMGHMDVVPVIPGTESDWTHPPFGGIVAEGRVWGRGALDDKATVVAVLEAVEGLVAEGFRPRRTIYLAFGHDEEVGGPDGAGAIAAELQARGVDPFAFVLDEGGAILDGLVPGVTAPVAIIGIAEKGYVNLELLVEGEGGHSSTPPEHTNIGILAAAIQRLEDDQFPARLDGPALAMFQYLAPEMGLLPRVAFANLWLTGPILTRMFVADRTTASMVRTTTAATMIDGGVKANVLPITARAVVNFRIRPGETRASVLERVRRVVGDERVQVREIDTGSDPSPVSDPESDAFRLLATTAREVAGADVLVAPYLVMGGTDAKYYSGRSANVFRFLPVRIGADALRLAHGTNERIPVESLATAVAFMRRLVQRSDELSSPAASAGSR